MSTNVIEQTQQTLQSVNKISSLNPQLTYSYVIRDTFYQLVPDEFKQYYFYNIRLMLNWYHGYVPEFHDPRNGIFSTRIGNSIIKELSKLTVGGNVFFKNRYKEKNSQEIENKSLDRFRVWSDAFKFQTFIKKLAEFWFAGGTVAMVSTINNNRDLVPKVYRIDQFFYQADFNGDPISFTGFIKSYTADIDNGQGRKKESKIYYLLENRYYDENWNPKIKVIIKCGINSVVSAQPFDTGTNQEVTWEDLPKQIKRRIKNDYGNQFLIGVPNDISPLLPNLGVQIIKLTSANTIPEVLMGESALANVVSYLVGYEQAYAEMITDLYLARGKVLTPSLMRNPTDPNNAYYSDFDGMLFTKMPYMGETEQKPMSVQFALRAKEWVEVRNNFAENIASAIGVAGSDIFAYLKDAGGSSKTATQIANEAQKTISYVQEKRSILKEALNEFLEIWRVFYKETDKIGVEFSSQNHINMLVTTEQVRVMHEVGFPYFDIYHRMYPELDTAQLNEMVERKYAELKLLAEIQSQAKANTNDNSNEQKEQPSKGDSSNINIPKQPENKDENTDKN
ncbi:MAG: hypothetical protein WCW63_01265 [Acholeplasmataceae bacterium]